ncbi:ribonucleotide reductase N-terminal alpha domain-containing protein [Corynebacterium sp.]|uniref:ribonucleotide reductase N-terminal alpha domain-containing protein n=1 Tax=Corynebacterium sp. TaxID=1720 RepID=UPI0025C33ADF|nr:ribonucleotide reductase N-terminal alpha domain-containing protein [Corynebacterium sp.]
MQGEPLTNTTYQSLNSEVNILKDGKLQLDKDHEAARAYFLEEVNQNTVFFHNLREKTNYLVDNNLWKRETVERFTFDQFKALFQQAYAHKYRFQSYMGALKFYTSYALRTEDGTRYYERFEDRVVMTAVDLSGGDYDAAKDLVDAIITGRFQPATPTFLNAGRAKGGERVSCFLLDVQDNMESIGRVSNSALQLSKRGGGVGINLTNLRESGAAIKGIPDAASGLVPVMKILESDFRYANQLGQRQGAGAVYISAHHPDIMAALDTKKENADEAIRIKTLSIGVIVPDITFELAKRDADMYLFSPYDVERVEGKPFSECDITDRYSSWVDDDRITKRKINARTFFQTLSEVQFESGYPYVLFSDVASRANPMNHVGRIQMSNLCVAPETLLLTRSGNVPIVDLAGQDVEVWNGEEWSLSRVEQTGKGQPLITVDFDNGASMDVTPYHKFYVKTGYGSRKVVETRAGELKPGDMIDKFSLPVVDNEDAPDFPYAYTAGLHSADGTYGVNGSPILRLYPGKTHLGEFIEYKSSSLKPDATGRVSYVLHQGTPRKYVVPDSTYSLKSRLEWLAGMLDGDGWGNGKVGLQIGSIHPEFLEDIRIMLTEMGVSSRWKKMRDAGRTRFKPGQKEYETKTAYRLIISGTESQTLRKLGLPTRRVIVEEVDHQRAANGYIRVESVIDEGRVDDTYCLNEPKRHKVIFNGVQTGNCSEIMQVQTPSVLNDDLTYQTVGHDISCNLGSFNMRKMLDLTTDEFTDTVVVATKALDQVSRTTSIDSVPSVRKGNDDSHSIGLGQMNWHGALGDLGIEYGAPESLRILDRYMARVTWAAMLASTQIAREHGPHAWFDGCEYDTGAWFERVAYPKCEEFGDDLEIMPGLSAPTREEWDALRVEVAKYGMANAYLQAIPPTGSISYINHSTSSIHPVASGVEIRKEGKLGRVYYPQPHLTNENAHLFQSASTIGYKKVIDTYAVSQHWVDQGQSLTLFFTDKATTRDINLAQIRAWRMGCKSLYYIRLQQPAFEGTEVEGTAAGFCESCAL